MGAGKKIIGGGGPRKESSTRSESQEPISITFFDSRNDPKAREAGIPPGIYFGLEKISQAQSQSGELLHEVGPHLMNILIEEGLMESTGDDGITIDAAMKLTLETSAAWKFEYHMYIPENQRLLIRAVRAPQEAKNLFSGMFRGKKQE